MWLDCWYPLISSERLQTGLSAVGGRVTFLDWTTTSLREDTSTYAVCSGKVSSFRFIIEPFSCLDRCLCPMCGSARVSGKPPPFRASSCFVGWTLKADECAADQFSSFRLVIQSLSWLDSSHPALAGRVCLWQTCFLSLRHQATSWLDAHALL